MFIIIYEEKKEKKSLLTRLKFNVQGLGVTSTHKDLYTMKKLYKLPER